MNKKKVVALVGPTGSGKTAWAKILAKKFNGKVISVDSRQIYKGLDIGTGKDKTFPQDLVDILTPDQPYSVAEFQVAANQLINQYLVAKNLPMLVGGTGLYLEAVLYGYVLPDLTKESLALRQKLEKINSKKLYLKLQKIDPDSASKIDPQNKRRIIRALEVSQLTRRPFSKLQRKQKSLFDSLIIGIKTDRQTLYAKVDARIDQMIKEGLVREVQTLLEKYPADLPAFNTIGYKEIIDYLKNRLTLKEAIEQIKFNTHAYIRRQETWFRRDKNIHWVRDLKSAEKLIKKLISP